MAAELHVALAGEPVVLHADRALYWPRGGSLLIADLHLGKGDAFRRAGVAVPSGGTRDDLARAQQIWFINSVRGWIPVTLDVSPADTTPVPVPAYADPFAGDRDAG